MVDKPPCLWYICYSSPRGLGKYVNRKTSEEFILAIPNLWKAILFNDHTSIESLSQGHLYTFMFIPIFRVLWATMRSNQSILRELSPEYSLEELMLKLKLQYFGHLVEKSLMLGKTEGRRRRGWRWLDGITNSKDMNLGKLREIVNRGTWVAAVHGVAKSWIQLSNSTTTLPSVLIPSQMLHLYAYQSFLISNVSNYIVSIMAEKKTSFKIWCIKIYYF